jgi:hypothetical protein
MNVTCEECGAKHFLKERPSDKRFTDCCFKGKVVLPLPRPPPELLLHLLTDSHPKAKHFLLKIRNYNSALAFASMGASISAPPNRGPYCYRIHGAVYHNTTPVGQINNSTPRYAQLYFIEAEQASAHRASVDANGGCDRQLMDALDALLREINPQHTIHMVDQYLSAERNWIDDPQELVDRPPYNKHIQANAYAPSTLHESYCSLYLFAFSGSNINYLL